jgi:glycosyltransferase involved in cell wall biosynthesis
MNIWTIAILTVTGREKFLERLRAVLDPQLEWQPVEVIVLKDARERSIGEKRQMALDMCKTPYISFIDDDDLISPKYVQTLLPFLKKGCYGVGFRGIMTSRNNTAMEFVHKAGLPYAAKPTLYNGTPLYTRPLNHLNPVMTDIAREIGYQHISEGEDYDFALRLAASGLIKDQCFADTFLYFYQFRGKDKKI